MQDTMPVLSAVTRGLRRLQDHMTLRQFAILMIDLDHFKSINDTHGHPAGDRVIHRVASMVSTLVRRPIG